MSDGRLYEVARAQRAAILRAERDAASELVRVYGGIWQRMRREIDFLLAELEAAREVGEMTDASWLFQHDRLARLVEQVERELLVYAQFADPLITRAQGAAVDAALDHAERLTRATAQQAGIGVSWTRLPVDALHALIGFTGDGSPLRTILNRLGPEAGARLREGLIQGVALGWNPERIARQLRDDFAGGLAKALTTCRTEVLRSYREATSQAYQANDDIIEGWVWISACTPRTCAACWAQHGTLHPLTERLEDHVCGRCTMVSKLRGVEQWLPESGVSQFAKLDPHVQRNILGPGRFEAYRAGALKLEDVAGYSHSADWGRSLRVRGLREMLGEERAKEFAAWGKAQYGGDKVILQAAERIAERHGVSVQYGGNVAVAELVTDGILNIDRDEWLPRKIELDEQQFPVSIRPERFASFYANETVETLFINPTHPYALTRGVERSQYAAWLAEEKYTASAHPLHAILHEFAHSARFRMTPTLYQRFGSRLDEGQSLIAKFVSRRAMRSPEEFAAEVLAGMLTGIEFNDQVMTLYAFFGGLSL